MNAPEHAAILQDSVSYKPGYRLLFTAVNDHTIVFHVDATVYDSLTGIPNTAIGYTRVLTITPQDPPDHLMRQIRSALHDLELHESDEWLQVNGYQFHPPHRHYEETE